MKLAEHNEWLNSQRFKPGTSEEICQCGTEKVIRRSSQPERMRAELLSYVFLDQFIFRYYQAEHSDFKKQFPGPKLRNHSFGGHASPSWFVHSRHDNGSAADWSVIQSVLSEYLTGGLEWLKKRCAIEDNFYWDMVQNELQAEFEKKHQPRLLSAIENAG